MVIGKPHSAPSRPTPARYPHGTLQPVKMALSMKANLRSPMLGQTSELKARSAATSAARCPVVVRAQQQEVQLLAADRLPGGACAAASSAAIDAGAAGCLGRQKCTFDIDMDAERPLQHPQASAGDAGLRYCGDCTVRRSMSGRAAANSAPD